MFYNAYAKSIITYGLLIYAAAAKTNLSRIESVQRRILRAFFRKRQDSLQVILAVNKINTVYELFFEGSGFWSFQRNEIWFSIEITRLWKTAQVQHDNKMELKRSFRSNCVSNCSQEEMLSKFIDESL